MTAMLERPVAGWPPIDWNAEPITHTDRFPYPLSLDDDIPVGVRTRREWLYDELMLQAVYRTPGLFLGSPRKPYFAPEPLIPTLKPSQFITEVLETIERYGWKKGQLGNTERGFCLLGAINHVGESTTKQATQEVVCALNSRLVGGSIPRYNDRLWRRQKHVISFLEKVRDDMVAQGR